MSFRVRHSTKVQQAPSRNSAVLYVAAEGKVVTQLGPERTLPDGQVRISVLPRGWMDASALEPLAGGEFLEDKGS